MLLKRFGAREWEGSVEVYIQSWWSMTNILKELEKNIEL